MAVTDIRPAGDVDALDQLADFVEQIGKFQESLVPAITLDAARAAVKSAGVGRARDLYLDELEAFAQAQQAKRLADVGLVDARKALADAMSEAEWELSGYFEVRSNKTYLTIDDQGAAVAEADQRSMTADERKAWIARRAEKQPAVAEWARNVAMSDEAAKAAADQVVLVERRLQAARHLLDAAVAELETYRLALTAPPRKETAR